MGMHVIHLYISKQKYKKERARKTKQKYQITCQASHGAAWSPPCLTHICSKASPRIESWKFIS